VPPRSPASTARAFQQPPHWPRAPGADQRCEHHAENGGEHGQGHRDQHHLVLLGDGLVGILAQQRQHVRAHAFQLLVEFVAQFVDAFEFIGYRFGVAGIEQGQQASILGVEAAAGIVVDGVEAGLEPAQRGYVAELGTFLDQSMNQCARSLDFQVDLSAQRIVAVAQRRILAAVGWRTELFDDDPAYQKPTLKRADIGTRQIAIGRDVSIRQLFDAGADLHHQHHGQDRGNGHHHDQRHGDAHDLSPDRQSDHGKTSPSLKRDKHIAGGAAAISAIDRSLAQHSSRFQPPLMRKARNAGRLGAPVLHNASFETIPRHSENVDENHHSDRGKKARQSSDTRFSPHFWLGA
jgi:hypothetical protein